MFKRLIEFFTSCKRKVEAAYQRGLAEGFAKAANQGKELDPHLIEEVVFTTLRMYALTEKTVLAHERAQKAATKEYREKLDQAIANSAPITPQTMERFATITARGSDLSGLAPRSIQPLIKDDT